MSFFKKMDLALYKNRISTFMALPEVGWPTAFSAFLHIGLFLLAIFGVPHVVHQDPYIHLDEIAMDVSLLEPESTEITEKAPPSLKTPLPRSKPVYNKRDSLPDIIPPQKVEIKEEVKEPETPKEAEPDVVKKPTLKPKAKPRFLIKPEKVKSKPQVSPKPEQPQRDITNLLKDLTPNDWENAQERINEDSAIKSSSGVRNNVVQMTSSNIIALNQGVQNCWNLNAGGRMAEKLIVKLRVFVNPDRSVRDVQIMDTLRYATDSHFKSAADAARWALLNPKCSTLNLPPEKYELWKSFIYVFDPSQML